LHREAPSLDAEDAVPVSWTESGRPAAGRRIPGSPDR